MMPFIHNNFLLGNKTAERLYHQYAANLPIIDYHCHLSPMMIANDRQFENLSQIWLEGDHYKWRAMRANGISERYCTGNASPEEKFTRWAATVPYTIGNPLYHWTHLELARYFNIYELLSPETADSIYEEASAMLNTKEFSTLSLIKKMKVEIICTTDDPADELEYHRQFGNSSGITLLPTFRPDEVIKTDDPERFGTYILKLGQNCGTSIRNFNDLIEALDKRHKFFHDNRCRLSDHGLERFFFTSFTSREVENVFKNLLKGDKISSPDSEKYKTAVMTEICRMNHKRGWIQQFHVGAIRNNNERMFRQMGPDTGWDSIGNPQDVSKMSLFLNSLDNTEQLAKTIIYNLNPADNEMIISMTGCFNDGTVPAKVQYGPGWWFLDQKNGMEKHLGDLAALGLLRRFIGMVTDSRSFLSFPRHEYFRRVACNFIGEEVEKGLIPDDDELLKPLVEGISYINAKNLLDSVNR
jgi:glucuronate isomerase